MDVKITIDPKFKNFPKGLVKELVKEDQKAYKESLKTVNDKYKAIIRPEYANAFKTSSKPSKFGPSLPKNYSKFANTFAGKIMKTNRGEGTYDFFTMYSKLKYYDVFYEGKTIFAKKQFMVIPISDVPLSKAKKRNFNTFLSSLISSKSAYIRTLSNGNKIVMAKVGTKGITAGKRVFKDRILSNTKDKTRRINKKKVKYVAIAMFVKQVTILKKYDFRGKYNKKIKQDIINNHKKIFEKSKIFTNTSTGRYIKIT